MVSTTNNKGFGLDSIRFLVDDTPYEYEVTGIMGHFIALKYNQGRRFEALNMAKYFGTLINRDLINE